MISRCERGFTLIEVVVAFAIFALSIGAIFEVLSDAVHTSKEARQRDIAWLTAESILSQLRVTPAPWPSEERGIAGRLRWWIHVQPYPLSVNERSWWSAYRVQVRVAPLHTPVPTVELDSVELARRRE